MGKSKLIPSEVLETEVAIVGAGPAGLIAAEQLSAAGLEVRLFDSMPSAGRKFLIAGKGGLNITHSEPFEQFISRYGQQSGRLLPMLQAFGPEDVRIWAASYGVNTFVGTSGRVFPVGMKAAPLLYGIKQKLDKNGVITHYRHVWNGFGNTHTNLLFEHPNGILQVEAKACLFALGGASWKNTGSTGNWVPLFQQLGVKVDPFKPANCGFDVVLTDFIRKKFDGEPIKTVAIQTLDLQGQMVRRQGEFILTPNGFEGSLIYFFSSLFRQKIEHEGFADITLDLLPDFSLDQIEGILRHDRGKKSFSTYMQRTLGLNGIKLALLHEFATTTNFADPHKLAYLIKQLPVRLLHPRPLDEAISSAGGVSLDAVNDELMLKQAPGLFCAGEMLDWEAPTGGYLITACLSLGVAAAKGIQNYLGKH